MGARGFQLRGQETQRSIAGQVSRGIPTEAGPFDLVILATQPPDVEAAAKQVRDHLADGALVVCLQNGLCEARVAPIVGPRVTVIGAVVAWGASMVEPGLYDRTSAGGFTLGHLDGGRSDALNRLAVLLEAIGPTDVTTNLTGARWSKLALNCAITSLGALSGERLGKMVRHRYVRRLALEIMSEVVVVALRESVKLEKVSGTLDLEWIALTPDERRQRGSVSLASKHAMLLAVGLRYRRLRSSMLRAMERNRPPVIDYLNGEVVARATRHELPTPVNRLLVQMIDQICRKERKPAPENLKELYLNTRLGGVGV